MKIEKLKLTAAANFLLFLTVKINGSCGAVPGQSPPPAAAEQAYAGYYLLGIFALLVPLVALYFLRHRKGFWTVLTGAAAALLLILALAGAFLWTIFLSGSCAGGDGKILLMLIQGEFLLMLALCLYQAAAWIFQKRGQG